MTVRNLLIVNAFLSLVSAVGLGLIPDQYAAPFGMTFDAPGALVARAFGAVLLGLAAMSWLGRDLVPDGRRVLAIGTGLGWTGFTLVMSLGLAGGTMGTAGVLWVVIGAVMGLGGLGAAAGVGFRE